MTNITRKNCIFNKALKKPIALQNDELEAKGSSECRIKDI